MYLNSFALSILADPITKNPCSPDSFGVKDGVVDARIFLKNSHGHSEWASGQFEYEVWEKSSQGYSESVKSYLDEIEYDRPIYEYFKMKGAILDVGGGAGTVREFLSSSDSYISIDPFIDAPHTIPHARLEAYKCLSKPLNFLAAMAEFLPFTSNSFDWVHMRSMLDHVQIPDLALLEAYRVLKPGGFVLIGMYVEGGENGRLSLKEIVKLLVENTLGRAGIDRWKDHHTWHPTYRGLLKLVVDNGFTIKDVFWQPHWKNRVCYVLACKV